MAKIDDDAGARLVGHGGRMVGEDGLPAPARPNRMGRAAVFAVFVVVLVVIAVGVAAVIDVMH